MEERQVEPRLSLELLYLGRKPELPWTEDQRSFLEALGLAAPL